MRPFAAIAILSLLPLSAAVADVYRSVDAQGHVLYSDTPTPGAQLIRTSGTHELIATPTPATTPTPTTTPTPAAKPAKSSDTNSAEQQLASRAVQNDVAQTRADQCKKAQDAYQQSVRARRIYNEESNGERTYLTDEEADKIRVNNKMQMDEACKDAVLAQ